MSSAAADLRRFARVALGPIVPAVRGVLDAQGAFAAWRSAGAMVPPADDVPRVAYLLRDFPAPPPRRNGYASGGAAKVVYLDEAFPHSHPASDILLIVSSVQHPHAPLIVRRAQGRGVRVVLNQNGVYYRAWYGPGWQAQNRPLAAVHRAADYVAYQSEFCRRYATELLGTTSAPSRVLYNPVDLGHFVPAPPPADAAPRLLVVVGSLLHRPRVRIAIRTVALLRRAVPDASLTIAGWDPGDANDAVAISSTRRIAMAEGVPTTALEFLPRFRRADARTVYQRAHVLLHPVYNDASPNVVVEALACGLPVVFSASGGVPELVGDAGCGIDAPDDLEVYHAPDPDALAEAACRAFAEWPDLSRRARLRAERQFSLDAWIDAHRLIFAGLAR